MIPTQLIQPLTILVWLIVVGIVSGVVLTVAFIVAIIYTLATDKKRGVRR